jgi:hypothetical protein
MSMLKQLFKNVFRKLSRPAKHPVARTMLTLEPLEARVLLASYLWTGASGTDLNWSTASNWLKNGIIAQAAPTTVDDVLFNNTVARDSVVDVNFAGTVKSITIDQTYAKTLTLNKDLLVTTEADISRANPVVPAVPTNVIAGSGTLRIGDHPTVGQPVLYTAVLNWTGGILQSPTTSFVDIGDNSTANIGGTYVKTLDGRIFYSYGTVKWTGGGNILLKNSGGFADAGVMNANLAADATIDGNGEAATTF